MTEQLVQARVAQAHADRLRLTATDLGDRVHFTAADFGDQLRRAIKTDALQRRIDAALEADRPHPESTCAGARCRRPAVGAKQVGFEEDARSSVVTPESRPPMTPRQGQRALVVGNQQLLLVQRDRLRRSAILSRSPARGTGARERCR